MTSRELVLNTLNMKNTSDRVPSELWYLPWAETNYPEAVAQLVKNYDMDVEYVKTVFNMPPQVERGDCFEIGEYVDGWGCVFTNIYSGIIGEMKCPLVTDDDWEDISRVHIPEEWLSFDVEQINAECAKSEKFMIPEFTPRPFEQFQFIRGTAELCMDLMDPPKKFLEFLERMHDFYCRGLKKWAQTDVQMLRMMDDWGTQNSLLVSPELWRKYFKPMYQDYIDIAHSAGKKMFMHTDGYVLDLMPELIDMGVDAINAQIFCMGIDKLKQFRGKITFWGEICAQSILPYGTVRDVERAVKEVYDALWQDGGCVAWCEFGPGAKPENVDAVYRTWKSLGGGK